VLVICALGLCANHIFAPAFLPAPSTDRAAGSQQASIAATAAAVTALGFAADPAMAVTLGNGFARGVVDTPLAHGAPGDVADGQFQALFEKCAFGGLLLSTVTAWWKGTVGGAGSNEQQIAGRPYSFWTLSFACASLVALLSDRWYASGHFPLSNMYESLSFLAWGITAVTIYFIGSESDAQKESEQSVGAQLGTQKRATADIAAIWASPVALGIVAFATLTLPKALQKSSALVPALQSNWLMMHVSVVMMSYATLMFGSVLCMAVVALSQPEDSPITQMRKGLVTSALQGVANGLSPQPTPAIAGVGPAISATTESESISEELEKASAQPAQMAATMPAPGMGQQQVMAGSTGSVVVEFSSQASVAKKELTEDDQLTLTLDDLAYRSILLGFGFLTIGIVSGAVWANEAWGSYWSWDPKETWALICWLIYAAYLHVRLQLGWDTRDSAKLGAFGFLVIWLCYIGVNLMGVGLHSYGFFLK